MNRLEDEWLHFKDDELTWRVFEDKDELAIALIEGIKNRVQQRQYEIG